MSAIIAFCMPDRTRILFVSGEVAPFAKVSEAGEIVRHLPEYLNDQGTFETRIMMPRYGTISERRNRLHEVIRLCGTSVPMGKNIQNLKVKVASIPGIRLQVYFMDNTHFFKRKGLHHDKQGQVFSDNTERSLFFGRSVVETVRKLRWKPDIVHAVGWISGLLPYLLSSEYADEPLFESTRVVYTPDGIDANATITRTFVKKMLENVNGELTGLTVSEVGMQYADTGVYPPSMEPECGKMLRFSTDPSTMTDQAVSLYSSVLSANAS